MLALLTASVLCWRKKKDSVKITRQAFHLPLGQIKSVGRAAFVMYARSYFLFAE